MVEVLTDVVLIVTGFQLVLLAVVLLVRLPKRNLGRNLLAGFLLAKALLILRWFSLRFGVVDFSATPGAYLVSAAGFFLLAPLLYLSIRGLCFRDFRLRPRVVAHLVPFVAMAVLGVVVAAIGSAGHTTGVAAVDELLVASFWRVFWTGNLVQILVYIVAMVAAVNRYRRLLGDRHSSVSGIDLGWLVGLLAVISLHWVFVTSRATLGLLGLGGGRTTAWLDLFSITIFLVFTTVLVVRGLAHARLFPGVDEASASGGVQLGGKRLELEAARLLDCMQRDRPHLDPALTVEQLAERLAIPAWQVSKLINSVFRQNFFHFINSYRVEEAKRRLENPAWNDETMLRILHEAGFNSKSTFNDAFRRHTGTTPTEYRRRMQRRPSLAAATPSIEVQRVH